MNKARLSLVESKDYERQLKLSQERLSLVVEAVNAGIWDWDMVSGTVYYDEKWKALLGYQTDEIENTYEAWQSRWHPDEAARNEQVIGEYLAGKTAKYRLEHRLRHKDGSYRWILTTGKITFDETGRPVRWAGSNIDITDRKRMEELLQESERKLRDFAQAMHDVSLILDETGEIIEVLSDNSDLIARPGQELVGLKVGQVIATDKAKRLLAEVSKTIHAARPRSLAGEVEIGGRLRFLGIKTAPMNYQVHGKRTVAVIITDITDRRETERMLNFSHVLRRQSDFLNDVISGKLPVNERIISFADSVGVDLNQAAFGCVILSERLTAKVNGISGDSLGSTHKRKLILIDRLRAVSECIVWDCGPGIGILGRLTANGKPAEEQLQDIINHLMAILRQFEAELPFAIGVSDLHAHPQAVPKMYQQAFNAATAARCESSACQCVLHYRDAGIFQFLPEIMHGEAAADYVEKNIGKLIHYDRDKSANLVDTLEELLRSTSVRETADKMFLHPKTVIFRKQRIETILNKDLDSFETRVALAVALKLYKLNK